MRIVLHAGSNKAGSTAIQETLSRSNDRLSASGLLYPRLGDKKHHSLLIPAVLDEDEYLANFSRQDPAKRQSGLVASEALWDCLRKQVDEISPQILLLSSEYIFGLRPASLRRFVSRLAALSEEISAIVYLRNPCEHYLSSAQQILKYGCSVKDPRIHQNYCQKLRKLRNTIPGKVDPRIFSRPLLFDGDVALDFLSLIVSGDQVKGFGISPLVANASISAEAMAFLSRFNREIWGDRRIIGHALNKAVLTAIRKEEKRRDYTKAKLKDKILTLVTRVHSEDAAELRDAYGVRFPGFDYSQESSAADRKLRAADDAFSHLKVSDIVAYDTQLEERMTMRVLAALAKNTGT